VQFTTANIIPFYQYDNLDLFLDKNKNNKINVLQYLFKKNKKKVLLTHIFVLIYIRTQGERSEIL